MSKIFARIKSNLCLSIWIVLILIGIIVLGIEAYAQIENGINELQSASKYKSFIKQQCIIIDYQVNQCQTSCDCSCQRLCSCDTCSGYSYDYYSILSTDNCNETKYVSSQSKCFVNDDQPYDINETVTCWISPSCDEDIMVFEHYSNYSDRGIIHITVGVILLLSPFILCGCFYLLNCFRKIIIKKRKDIGYNKADDTNAVEYIDQDPKKEIKKIVQDDYMLGDRASTDLIEIQTRQRLVEGL